MSPAYDLCHAEGSDFTRNHQLSINGKTNDFTLADIKYLAEYVGLPRSREKQILQQICEVFSTWQSLAAQLAIPLEMQKHVLNTIRLKW